MWDKVFVQIYLLHFKNFAKVYDQIQKAFNGCKRNAILFYNYIDYYFDSILFNMKFLLV